MNELQVFHNDEFGSVRTLTINGDPYFVGKDVADILGYSNSRDALSRHVDDEDKNSVVIHDGIPGNPNQVVINESGLYSLILSSKLPAAKRFKRWVTAEVLPSIRRHGMYAIDEIIANPDLGIAALQALKAEREKRIALTAQVAMQTQQIAEMQPKVSYYDLVLSCPDALPITILAKDYGWTAQQMNKFLHEQGVQYKLQKTWLLYARYQDKGYTHSETYPYTDHNGNVHNSINTKWTQSGRLFIYELMKAAGNLPLVERDG
jgi:hypothetical protein|nr:MAG TPA: repressor domain protein [Caudoviricetes sp.]